jgi:hypothetical protein
VAGARGLELANVGFLKSLFDSRIGIWNIEPGFQEMPDYSPLMFAALMMGVHSVTSDRMMTIISSGVALAVSMPCTLLNADHDRVL